MALLFKSGIALAVIMVFMRVANKTGVIHSLLDAFLLLSLPEKPCSVAVLPDFKTI